MRFLTFLVALVLCVATAQNLRSLQHDGDGYSDDGYEAASPDTSAIAGDDSKGGDASR